MNLYNMKYDKSINNEEVIVKAKLGCETSKELLFKNNIPLIRKLVHRWKSTGSIENVEDLMSMGYIGLAKAYNNFDSSKNVKFSTFAGKLVWHEFIKIARNNGATKRSKYIAMSIDEEFSENSDAISWHELISDTNSDNEYIEVESNIFLNNINEQFNAREISVLKKRFIEERGYQDIAREIGVSRQAIQQTESKCLKSLRNNMRLIG